MTFKQLEGVNWILTALTALGGLILLSLPNPFWAIVIFGLLAALSSTTNLSVLTRKWVSRRFGGARKRESWLLILNFMFCITCFFLAYYQLYGRF